MWSERHEQLRAHVRVNDFGARVTTIRAALAEVRHDNAPLFVSTEPRNSGLSSLAAAPAYTRNGWVSHDRTVKVSEVGALICETVWRGSAHPTLCAAGFVPTRLEDFGHLCNILYERETGTGV